MFGSLKPQDYEKLAHSLNGRVLKSRGLGCDVHESLCFWTIRQNVEVLFYCFHKKDNNNKESWTQLHITFPGVEQMKPMKISREGLLNKLMKDIEVGDPKFDKTFDIQAHDARWIRQILSPEIRSLHLALPRFWVAKELHGEFIIRRETHSISYEEAHKMIELGLLYGVQLQHVGLLEAL